MSTPVPEPPALVRSPEEGQRGSCEPGHILAQLSAALEKPDIKALEWSEDGQGVLVRTELYEEEMGKNKELFPELANLGCVAALRAWLLAYGFKPKGAKVDAQVLLLQHPNFQRAQPTAEEPGALGGNAGLSAKPQPKRKKRTRRPRPPRGTTSQDTLGQRPRLRPLYQYINYDMPELMHPSAEEDEVPELAQTSQVPMAPGRPTAPQLEDTWAGSTPAIPAPGADDKSMQADTERMLGYAANLVPPPFPQYE
ncbi:uncharacterized protein C16orf86 homolog [Rissa tridactyla]|uniref:uncharacterized protein C16orf86 homolog n=1 Tax=Rissa tridactyla TaxID=75485 RepID=UPI0023BA5952|nr:uncharacterized protein C16orf86 homolog [Rissa tridactyla]